MWMFYLIRVVFLLDPDMATRFRLRFIRPGVQRSLAPEINALLAVAWNDGEAKLDLTKVTDQKDALATLARLVDRLVAEYPDSPAFNQLAQGIAKAASTTIVDQIGWLDDGHQHRALRIETSEQRPAVRMSPKKKP
jgi:hypothetical protein